MDLPIILIGPERAGKSTVGGFVAAQLGLPLLHLWSVCGEYWNEIGFDPALQQQAWNNGGADGVYDFMLPFDAHAVERAVAEHPRCIMELGAPQSVYDDAEIFARVRMSLDPYENVVLVLPSSDLAESELILARRGQAFLDGTELTEHFLRHHSNHDLAKHVVYTEGRTPEETCDDILRKVEPSAREIILIGPMGAGKSTQGGLLAERLKVPQVSLDQIRRGYYREIGWDETIEREIREKEGRTGVEQYWKRFDPHAVERALSDHPNGVIDFGAGQSVYIDDEQFARVRDLLAPYPNVVLLLPSPDLDRSLAVLRERRTTTIKGVPANRFFLTHPSNRRLAKFVVYTEGKTPQETGDEVLRHYRGLAGVVND